MNFYFCEGCGKRVTEADIKSGQAKNKKLKGVYCTTCSVGISTMESLPLTDKKAKEILEKLEPKEALKPDRKSTKSNTLPLDAPKRNRRSSAIGIPTSSSGKRKERKVAGEDKQPPATKASHANLIAMVGGATLVLIFAGVFFLTGKPKDAPQKERARLKKTENKPAEPPSPAQHVKSAVVPEPTTTATTPPTTPLEPVILDSKNAWEALQQQLARLPDEKNDLKIALLNTFLQQHNESSFAPRAGLLLRNLQPDAAPEPKVPAISPTAKAPDIQDPPPDASIPNPQPPPKAIPKTDEPKAAFLKGLQELLAPLQCGDLHKAEAVTARMATDKALDTWQSSASVLSQAINQIAKHRLLQKKRREKLIGKSIRLDTTKGTRKGIITKFTEDKLFIQATYKTNGITKKGATLGVLFSDLKPTSRKRFFPSFKASSTEGWIAQALLNFSNGQLKNAQHSITHFAKHKLADPLTTLLNTLRDIQHEEKAKSEWITVVAASKKVSSEAQTNTFIARLTHYENTYGTTNFGLERKSEGELLRKKMAKRTRRSKEFIASKLKGKVTAYNSQSGQASVIYNFSHPSQLTDFVPLKAKTGHVQNGAFTFLKDGGHLTIKRFEIKNLTLICNLANLGAGSNRPPCGLFIGSKKGFLILLEKGKLSLLAPESTQNAQKLTGPALTSVPFTRPNKCEFGIKLEADQLHVSINRRKILSHKLPFTPDGNSISWIAKKDTHLKIYQLAIMAEPDASWLDEILLTQSTLLSLSGPKARWTNAGGDKRWGNAQNWSSKQIPGAGDNVIFSQSSTADCIVEAGCIPSTLGSLSLLPGYNGRLEFKAGFGKEEPQTFQVSGSILLLSGRITVNGLVTGSGKEAEGIGVTFLAKQFTIGKSAILESDARGFPADTGPGRPPRDNRGNADRGGAAHGGMGSGYHLINTSRYGDAAAPTTLGSGSRTPGGGAIRISCSDGTVRINGTISCTGGPGATHGYSGAGGSIFIECSTFTGNTTGHLRVKGGAPGSDAHPGGGGRIAVTWKNSSYKGSYNTSGGRSNKSTGYPGTLSIPSGGDLHIRKSIGFKAGHYHFKTLRISNSSILLLYADFKNNKGCVLDVDHLIIERGSSMRAPFGFPMGMGPKGPVRRRKTFGGVHGGKSFGNSEKPYGNPLAPEGLGSGGGGKSEGTRSSLGWGGGAIRVNAKITIVLNGSIRANGMNGGSDTGGGAGGSIFLNCRNLKGSGSLSANGGTYGASGGRIAVYFEKSEFSETATATGGTAHSRSKPGGNGTVIFKKR